MFFHYSQNNSGGSFDFDEKEGITHHVIIEADSDVEADKIAEEIGLYWNGVCSGLDCSCCGDRWSPASDWGGTEGDAVPMVYGQVLGEDEIDFKWMKDGYEACVHYLDGRKEWY